MWGPHDGISGSVPSDTATCDGMLALFLPMRSSAEATQMLVPCLGLPSLQRQISFM